MAEVNVRQELQKVIEGSKSLAEVIARCQQYGVIFRPYPVDALFGKGVSTAMAELILALDDGDVFARDLHGSTCMMVVHRTADVMFLQGEFVVKPTESA
ncbi:MAG: hypothetical protein N2689_15790 [Verrucomicrobiae bacterium]|nr:hypothetical protein [Verrucomicrobiae bacterium]